MYCHLGPREHIPTFDLTDEFIKQRGREPHDGDQFSFKGFLWERRKGKWELAHGKK